MPCTCFSCTYGCLGPTRTPSLEHSPSLARRASQKLRSRPSTRSKLKSRMVVQGCQEQDPGIRSDSPTASLLAFNFVTAITVVMVWTIEAYDASTAYLQSQGVSRLLILRPPRPPPPGISPLSLLRAKGSIYGTRDAGRSWWRKLYRVLLSKQWVMSKLEPALFFLYEDKNLTGILISHVDDLYCSGIGKLYEESMRVLEKEIHLKKKVGEFRFCGKNVKQLPDGSIAVDQEDAIWSLDYVVLDKKRRAQPNARLTEPEKTQFRALIGSLGWIALQTRPDVLVNVSIASQQLGSPSVRDMVDLNKVVRVLKETPAEKWNLIKPSCELKDLAVFAMSDSSFANTNGLKSQTGYVIGLCTSEITTGVPTAILVLETYSGSIKRVCRSTLAAETNGFLTAAEAADYVRSLLLELQHPGCRMADLDRHFVKGKLHLFTDAKSLESTLNKDAGQPNDKRVRILLAQVKEILDRAADDEPDLQVLWVDTAQMLADVLTKVGCEREPLLEALSKGTWTLQASAEALARKQAIRDGRKRRKAAARPPKDEDGCETVNEHGS